MLNTDEPESRLSRAPKHAGRNTGAAAMARFILENLQSASKYGLENLQTPEPPMVFNTQKSKKPEKYAKRPSIKLSATPLSALVKCQGSWAFQGNRNDPHRSGR